MPITLRTILACLLILGLHVKEACAQNEGMPFGDIQESDIERFAQFAERRGFAFTSEMQHVYDGDAHSLGRLFGLSLSFASLDKTARTYGQILYSSFLAISEQGRLDVYVKTLDAQSPPVRQRIRDFLYFPVLQVPKSDRKNVELECRKTYPRLFPSEYTFARDDALFLKDSKK